MLLSPRPARIPRQTAPNSNRFAPAELCTQFVQSSPPSHRPRSCLLNVILTYPTRHDSSKEVGASLSSAPYSPWETRPQKFRTRTASTIFSLQPQQGVCVSLLSTTHGLEINTAPSRCSTPLRLATSSSSTPDTKPSLLCPAPGFRASAHEPPDTRRGAWGKRCVV